MKLGFKSVTLNPEKPSKRFGPGDRTMIKVKGDLEYKLFALQKDGQTPYLCVSAPLVEINMHAYTALKQSMEAKIGSPINLTFCATHTHYSVNANDDEDYLEAVASGLARAYQETEMRQYPDLSYSVVTEPFNEVGQCRITGEKARVLVTVISLYSAEERIASFVVYNSHPTTLNFFEDYLSSVGPGLLQKNLQAAYPDEFFTYFIGAAGDVSTRFVRKSQTWDEVVRLTNIVTDEVEKLLSSDPARHPLEDIVFEECWLDAVRKYLDVSQLVLPENASEREKQTLRETGSHHDRDIPEEDLPKKIYFQRLEFGSFSMIFTPFELFSEYLDYTDLDRGILINCANDHVCYLSGLKNKYMSFELMGESIAYETKLSIIELIKKWSS